MEYFRLVTKKGRETGRYASRNEAHRLGLWHPAVHIWIVHPQQGLLLQRRAEDKETFAGRWDVSCAGHLDYSEAPLTGAVRELKEELGLLAEPSELQFLFRKAHTQKGLRPDGINFIDREFTLVYLLRRKLPLEDIRPDGVEVSGVRYWTPEELKKELSRRPLRFCPHYSEYNQLIKNYSKHVESIKAA